MDALTTAKFKPFESPGSRDYSGAKVSDDQKVLDSTDKDKVNFKDLILNSNDDVMRERAAQKNGDNLRMAKTDAEFAKMMADKANQANLRKPQNELDKDAFLKLFVTQMRNQDPLNPDNSAQMAAQLAQFHGLEQMMNVNKNLEKMQGDEALGRAVGLIGFVGKDIKMENGKLMLEGGKLATSATVKMDGESVKTLLEVRDASGVVVASEDLGPQPAGEHQLAWDGIDKDGKKLPNGAYTFAVTASDVRGEPITTKISSAVKVTGVDLQNGGSFYTPIGKVRVNEVSSVGDSGFVGSAAAAEAALRADAEAKVKAAAAAAKPVADGEQKTEEAAAAVPPPGVPEVPKTEAAAALNIPVERPPVLPQPAPEHDVSTPAPAG